MALKLAVIGDPVDHSRSPALQTAFLREAGIDGTYEAIRVERANVAEAIDDLRARGYTGLNVTTPLKEEALRLCVHLETPARAAEAVNTLWLGDEIAGTNTDGSGAIAAIEAALGMPLDGRRVAVVGAGPTARAAIAALSERTLATLALWNRTQAKAQRLAAMFGATLWHGEPLDLAFCALPPDVVLEPSFAHRLREVPLIVDANYGDRALLGERLGRHTIDGTAMLARGARASFEWWLERV